jgi:hypothetical protein
MKWRNYLMPAIPLFVLASWFSLAPRGALCQAQTEVPPAKDSTPPEAKPKKVWTNDNIRELQSDDSLSIVGGAAGGKKSNPPAKPDPNQADIQAYRKQLATLRADVEKLDAQIATTQAFINGENVGEAQQTRPSRFGNPQEQLRQFEQKRDADLAKIDSIEDAARRKGIPPGALR